MPGARAQELLYAGERLRDDDALEAYNVPPGCQCLIAIEAEQLRIGKPDADSDYSA